MPEKPSTGSSGPALASLPHANPATDAPGASPAGSDPEKLGLERAARVAGGEVPAIPAKRLPGKRGPDRQPRKPRAPVPLGQVARGSAPASLASALPAPELPPGPLDGIPDGSGVDEDAERLFVDGALDLLELATGSLKSLAVYKLTKDGALSEAAYESAKIPPAIREKLEKSGRVLVRKYALDVTYAPEIAFGGALVLYLSKNVLDVRKVKAEISAAKPAPVTVVPQAVTVNN